MNFIDRLKEEYVNELGNNDTHVKKDIPHDESIDDILGRIMNMTDEDIQEHIFKIADRISDNMIHISNKFYDELKGKFTLKQISEMILKVYDIIGGNM